MPSRRMAAWASRPMPGWRNPTRTFAPCGWSTGRTKSIAAPSPAWRCENIPTLGCERALTARLFCFPRKKALDLVFAQFAGGIARQHVGGKDDFYRHLERGKPLGDEA